MVERIPEPADADTALNVGMAAERTWLAWWRTALVATAGALGVGRLAPRLLHAAPAVYIVLGCGYALLAVALLVVGSRRHRALGRAIERGEPAPLGDDRHPVHRRRRGPCDGDGRCGTRPDLARQGRLRRRVDNVT